MDEPMWTLFGVRFAPETKALKNTLTCEGTLRCHFEYKSMQLWIFNSLTSSHTD